MSSQPQILRCCSRSRNRFPGRTNHCRVYADHFAADLREAHRSFPIQSGVGLNDVVDQAARLRVHRAPERADHTRGDTGLKAKRVSDRDYDLTDPQVLGIRQADIGKMRRIDSNDGEIGVGIIAH